MTIIISSILIGIIVIRFFCDKYSEIKREIIYFDNDRQIKSKIFDAIRNKNKDSNVLETTKSNYLIIEGEYGSKEYSSDISFQFIKVPYDIDKELEDEKLNIERENYRFELKQGMYRDMTKINENFKKLGIDVDKI